MAEIFWQFLSYSFFGFLLEVAFARATRATKRDRKCLFVLPLCPVYGLGALLVVHLPAAVRERPWLLLVCGALAAAGVEYAVDWLYEKAFRVRFWDYSALPWNLNGRVCLLFSGIWGLLSLALVYWVHPALTRWTALLPARWALPVFLFFLMDAFYSALLLRATQDTASLRWYDRFRRTAKERS